MANLLAVTCSLLTGSPLLTGASTYRPSTVKLGGLCMLRVWPVVLGSLEDGKAVRTLCFDWALPSQRGKFNDEQP